MKLFQNAALITDLDGTLLTDQKTVSEKDQQALRYFTENGGLLGFATGRSPRSASVWRRDLPVNGPCIHLNGSLVWDPVAGKPLKIWEIEKAPLLPILEWILHNLPDTVIELFTPEGDMFQISDRAYLDPYVEMNHDPYEWSTLEEMKNRPWVKVLLHNSREHLRTIHRMLEETSPRRERFNFFYTLDVFLEITPAGGDKGSARRWLCTDYRESLSERKIIAAGDFDNDVHMLREADCGAAVGNAEEVAKEAADVIIADNNHSPMADLIQRLEKGELPLGED